MISKNNNIGKKEIIDHLNKIAKSRQKNPILKERPQLLRQKQHIPSKCPINCNKNIYLKPIIISNKNNNNINNDNNNNNDSNTSIKASNKITCNLIGKMINDVSKSTISGLGCNKQNNKTATNKTKATSTTTTITEETLSITRTSGTNTDTKALTKYSSFNCSEGGLKIAHFHNSNNNNSTSNIGSSYNNRVNEHPRIFQITSLNEANRENLSFANDAGTLNDLISKQQQQQQQRYRQQQYEHLTRVEKVKGETLVTVKQPPLFLQKFNRRTRHKNITIIPLTDSYQRTVDLDAKLDATADNSQCELLEFNQTEKLPAQKDYKIADCQLKFKSLAERKALLKREFFKDLNANANDTATTNFVKLKLNNQTLNKRILKKQHNLKLKIPKDCNNQLLEESLEQQPEVDFTLSLVALRKLDLQKKQQTDLKSDNKNFHKTSSFPRVKELAKKFDCRDNGRNNCNNMILPQTNLKEEEAKTSKLLSMQERQSPMSDEGCNIGQSPYSSDDDNDSIRTTNTAIQRLPNTTRKDKVARSASSDSALGLEVDDAMDVAEPPPQQQKRRMTLTVTDLPLRPALLPLAEPTLLPDSPTLDAPLPNVVNTLPQTQVPSKVLLEERVVEIPEDPRSGFSSRRESSQSCFSDFPPGEMQGVRFVRTPSVVVSDYSDDVTCGITLEEIEYFRAQRSRRRRSSLETSGTEKDALDHGSDISASSSCSNLYYCGSTISALDGAECLVNGVRHQLERKTSDCSTCSVSGDEDSSSYFCIPEQPEGCQDITDMLANQHLSSKRSKKVGMAAPILSIDTTNTV